ncbi:hypothetical protein Pr1d_34730 [Bythopirellula goksoeyrii]|uniref:Uncharacterized protein n=1 Tax=Bythopirellula goksoeyrii TaxID=1400387 RepID=A0A5B9QAP3_9BACT|nr:hypothetical protein Pr1d_34730 [Bythopirellula goksoeyrii]
MTLKRLGDSPPRSLAEPLRSSVSASALSVNRIAKLSNVDQSTLNKFMNGIRANLRLDVADRLFRRLGLRVLHKKQVPQK